jgi:hypothetical protein
MGWPPTFATFAGAEGFSALDSYCPMRTCGERTALKPGPAQSPRQFNAVEEMPTPGPVPGASHLYPPEDLTSAVARRARSNSSQLR